MKQSALSMPSAWTLPFADMLFALVVVLFLSLDKEHVEGAGEAMLNIRWGKAATHHINQLPDPSGIIILGEKIRGNVSSHLNCICPSSPSARPLTAQFHFPAAPAA